jgi:hypothetical protein
MNGDHQEYIKKMRKDGANDDDIKKTLAGAGWRDYEITSAFASLSSGKPLPPPPPHALHDEPAAQQAPIAVVQRYTTAGMEYSIMFLALLFGATSLGTWLHQLLDSLYRSPQSSDALPSVTAIVTIPIFLVLFFRLRGKEKSDETVKADSSRRRGVQIALLVTFVWGITSVIFYLYQLLSPHYAGSSVANDPVLQFLHLLITLAIAGGIFIYYWIDEHRHKV